MFETLISLEMLLLIALAAVWALTGIAANGLKYAASRKSAHPLWRRAARIGSWTGVLLAILWGVNTAATWLILGWEFVMDRVAVMLPLLTLPALSVIAFALRRTVARSAGGSARGPLFLLSWRETGYAEPMNISPGRISAGGCCRQTGARALTRIPPPGMMR